MAAAQCLLCHRSVSESRVRVVGAVVGLVVLIDFLKDIPKVSRSQLFIKVYGEGEDGGQVKGTERCGRCALSLSVARAHLPTSLSLPIYHQPTLLSHFSPYSHAPFNQPHHLSTYFMPSASASAP